MVVNVYVELTSGLTSGFHTIQWAAEACFAAAGLAWQQLGQDRCGLASYGAPMALGTRASSTATRVHPVVSNVKTGPAVYNIGTAPFPGCDLQGLGPRWP